MCLSLIEITLRWYVKSRSIEGVESTLRWVVESIRIIWLNQDWVVIILRWDADFSCLDEMRLSIVIIKIVKLTQDCLTELRVPWDEMLTRDCLAELRSIFCSCGHLQSCRNPSSETSDSLKSNTLRFSCNT